MSEIATTATTPPSIDGDARIDTLCELLRESKHEELSSELTTAMDDLSEKLDNLSDRAREGAPGVRLEEKTDAIQCAIDAVDAAEQAYSAADSTLRDLAGAL